MEDTVKELPNSEKFKSYIEDIKKNVSPMMLSGLTDQGKLHLAYATKFYTERPICIITYNEMQAKKLVDDLKYFSKNIKYFPKREILAYDYISESKDILFDRISCLNSIYENKAPIVVTTIEAVLQKIVPMDVLYKSIFTLKIGDSINLEDIKQKLVMLGYERCDIVEARGQFGIRGGILDIAITENTGIRIELWGEEIDSIRYFDINMQRSTEKLNKAKIYPVHEFVLDGTIEDVIAKINVRTDARYRSNSEKAII